MIRRSCFLAVATVMMFAATSQGVALAFHRFNNIHGSSCERSDPALEQITCNQNGVKVQSTSASLSCPVEWAQDSNPTTALQKMVVTLFWFSVPTSGGGSFSPSCTFYLNTPAGGGWSFNVPVIVNPNTSTPSYVFTVDATMLPLPIGSSTTPVAIGGISSTVLYCIGVPQGVGIAGYTVDACYSSSLGSC